MSNLVSDNPRFGRLTVVAEAGRNKHGKLLWKVRCDCGSEKVSLAASLKSGRQTSCGCARIERVASINKTHGMSASPEYVCWMHMKKRCNNPKDKRWHRYGGRGIRVCEEWERSFEAFYNHIGPRPTPKHSVERIDRDKGYEPGNVKWATAREQAANTSRNVYWHLDGETVCLSEFSRRTGVPVITIRQRIKKGWPLEKAFAIRDYRRPNDPS